MSQAGSSTAKNEMVSLLSIKEFSAMCGVMVSTLRFWDETGLLSPAWRNEKTRYRYYSPEQIMTAKLLETLVKLNIPLRNYTETNGEPVTEHALHLCRSCCRRLETEIAQMQATRALLQNHASLIEESQSIQPEEIAVRTLPERPFRLIPLATAGGRAGHDYMCQSLAQARGDNSPFGYAFRSFNALLKQPCRPTQLVSFDPKGPGIRQAGEYLVGAVKCGYGENSGLPRRMHDYALENGLEPQGPAYMIYLHSTAGIAAPEEYLLQISVGVKRISA